MQWMFPCNEITHFERNNLFLFSDRTVHDYGEIIPPTIDGNEGMVEVHGNKLRNPRICGEVNRKVFVCLRSLLDYRIFKLYGAFYKD